MSNDNQAAISPYLFFGGHCADAIDFYQKTLGATVGMVMKHRDNPEPSAECPLPPGYDDKIMHAEITIRGTMLMLSDGCGEPSAFTGFSLTLQADADEIDGLFNALAKDGTVTMPLQRTFWTPKFGMLTDKFGIQWMLMVPQAMAA